MDESACVSKKAFWVLVGSVWVVGLLGIIVTYMTINSINTINNDLKREKKSTTIPLVILIVFILIICGASIYGFALFRAPNNTLEGAKKYLKEFGSTLYSTQRTSDEEPTSEGVEMGEKSGGGEEEAEALGGRRSYRTHHHKCPHHK